ncbi:hypothetical protein QBC46DRAFT_105568 [Diplogelasinospora grovesii]|uniref:Azaphilone pigments biosynthesis cluster protein L N-terminal domain-containing protein n=1 Tax=Diplogelasinospora grovesii TaxID=303347 RepID=A0AAN6RYQ3_9PEZI|nr:hypothetical protein QBC46DRAFT_105568 [Diplogelasinospora grovesii]
MAEAIGVGSPIAGLVVAAMQLTAIICRTIDDVRDTPRTLRLLSEDLKGFASTLDTLQGYLDHDDTRQGVLYPASAAELEVVLTSCVHVFSDLSTRLRGYFGSAKTGGKGETLGAWRRLRLSLKSREFEGIRSQLQVQKSTSGVAVTVANFINNTAHASSTVELRQELSGMKTQLTSLLEELDQLKGESSINKGAQRGRSINALQRYAESVKSSIASHRELDNTQRARDRSRPRPSQSIITIESFKTAPQQMQPIELVPQDLRRIELFPQQLQQHMPQQIQQYMQQQMQQHMQPVAYTPGHQTGDHHQQLPYASYAPAPSQHHETHHYSASGYHGNPMASLQELPDEDLDEIRGYRGWGPYPFPVVESSKAELS